MSGKENTSGEAKKPINALLDGDYVGKEVVFIAFDKEKSSVTLDDNFILIQAMEKRERIVKIVATIIACIFLVGIVAASMKLIQADTYNEEQLVPIVTDTPVVSETQEPTEEPTVEPTIEPTKKPKRTKKPEKATKEPVTVTEEPAVITDVPVVTKEPVITNAPVVTEAPKPTKDPFQEEDTADDPFEVE